VSVRTGISGPERTEVLSGLSEGAQVIVSPTELRDGRHVRARPAAASASASAPAPAH
jgi:hypothetical protein